MSHVEISSASTNESRRAKPVGSMEPSKEIIATVGLSGTNLSLGRRWAIQQCNRKKFNMSRSTVLLWRNRFEDQGPNGLTRNQKRGPSHRRLEDEKVRAIVEATLHSTTPDATHWSTRTMAKTQGVCRTTVAGVLKVHGLQPHRIKTFKLSDDKHFVEKLTDVMGLYFNHPAKALLLCVDEKSQIQALDRAQRGFPMKKGRCGTMAVTINVTEQLVCLQLSMCLKVPSSGHVNLDTVTENS